MPAIEYKANLGANEQQMLQIMAQKSKSAARGQTRARTHPKSQGICEAKTRQRCVEGERNAL